LSYGLTLSERGTRQKVMEAQGAGSVPSASPVFRFLKRDGTDGLEGRGQGHAHIPLGITPSGSGYYRVEKNLHYLWISS
jgi:hypothetical protein